MEQTSVPNLCHCPRQVFPRSSGPVATPDHTHYPNMSGAKRISTIGRKILLHFLQSMNRYEVHEGKEMQL